VKNASLVAHLTFHHKTLSLSGQKLLAVSFFRTRRQRNALFHFFISMFHARFFSFYQTRAFLLRSYCLSSGVFATRFYLLTNRVSLWLLSSPYSLAYPLSDIHVFLRQFCLLLHGMYRHTCRFLATSCLRS
jgi:hypothetical protein